MNGWSIIKIWIGLDFGQRIFDGFRVFKTIDMHDFLQRDLTCLAGHSVSIMVTFYNNLHDHDINVLIANTIIYYFYGDNFTVVGHKSKA